MYLAQKWANNLVLALNIKSFLKIDLQRKMYFDAFGPKLGQ